MSNYTEKLERCLANGNLGPAPVKSRRVTFLKEVSLEEKSLKGIEDMANKLLELSKQQTTDDTVLVSCVISNYTKHGFLFTFEKQILNPDYEEELAIYQQHQKVFIEDRKKNQLNRMRLKLKELQDDIAHLERKTLNA